LLFLIPACVSCLVCLMESKDSGKCHTFPIFSMPSQQNIYTMLHAMCSPQSSQYQGMYKLYFPFHCTVQFTCSEIYLFGSIRKPFTLSRTLYGSSFKVSPHYATDETEHSYCNTQSKNNLLPH